MSEEKSEQTEQIDAVNQQIESARHELQALEQALAVVDGELEGLADQRAQYELLQRAVESVQALQEQGAAELFWGDRLSPGAAADHLVVVGRQIAEFEATVDEVEQRRTSAFEQVAAQQDQIGFLAEDLYDLKEAEESRLNEWILEREETPLPRLAQIMPWMRGFEDDRRFRQSLAGTLAASLLLGLLIPFIDIPLPERDEVMDVPERFVQLIQKQEQKPVPPPRVVEPEPEEAPPEPEQKPIEVPEERPPETKPKVVEEPKPAVQKQESTRERVATKGILAFRDSFSNLADSRPSAKLGAAARINNSGQNATGRPERNMVTTLATGSSGGINLSAISRDVGTGGGGAMEGVQTTQVASSIAGAGGVDRPLSAGGVAGRTDEEIQIVFDRYKAALYRLYNRELRKDPTLRGQLVLQLTIEPDGSVSVCRLQASDMDAPVLAQQVVTRVSGFDFGAKDVPPVTIVYPIDFLPTA